jgi:2-oxoglutarate/2-oxoacid ferredoxin oxidoreductase subunit beta
MKEHSYKDFRSENEVRWCAGCGNYAIMNAIQRTMAGMGIPRERFAVISGIGCSSRIPYYMSTYGFHTIHGRAAAVASGVKCANPRLSVWVMTGDGDAMAIGGNHFIHLIRRNVDVNLILFNNRIYGLTKGQYSPTSERGVKTKTSPFGTIEDPFIPGQLALGAGGTFFARTIDVDLKLNQDIFTEAAEHKGTSVVEVLQNCVIFNNGIHSAITDPEHKADRQLFLKQGNPMIFGEKKDKGLIMEKGRLKVVQIGKNGRSPEDVLVHDATEEDPLVHMALIQMRLPDYPVALGVIRNAKAPAYDREMTDQIKKMKRRRKISSVEELMNSGNTWEVEGNGKVTKNNTPPSGN